MNLFDDAEQAGWLVVEGWETFQHYSDRRPIWIKTYLDLLDRDAYLDLTGSTRAVLHGLWLLTAKSPEPIRVDTRRLSRALAMKVTKVQIEALCDAGFISISASKVASKTGADSYTSRARPRARGEAEAEVEREGLSNVSPETNGRARTDAELPVDLELARTKLLAKAPDLNPRMLDDFHLPAAAWFAAAEEVDEHKPSHPEKYVFTLFQTWAREGRYATSAAFEGPEPERGR